MKETIEKIKNYPEHLSILKAIFNFFKESKSTMGLFLSGSLAHGSIDKYSDLDIGVVCRGEKERDILWKERWSWEISSWFHRFDADHVKPYFIIYLYEPAIKADISLYTFDDLPSYQGAPYRILWDKSEKLLKWAEQKNSELIEHKTEDISLNADEIIHDDERIWAWLFYIWAHLSRGEYYLIAANFFMLRKIIEKWHSYINGSKNFSYRRIEIIESEQFLSKMINLFPKPTLESLKKACLILIEMQIDMRNILSKKMNISWNTSDNAIEKIQKLIEGL